MPFSPGAAAMPERGARTPILIGVFCAIAGAKTPSVAAKAPIAAADFSTVRRDSFFMRILPRMVVPAWPGVLAYSNDISVPCHRTSRDMALLYCHLLML